MSMHNYHVTKTVVIASLLLMLTACGGDSSPQSSTELPEQSTTISGKIKPNFNRNGQSNESTAGRAVLSSAAMNASGSFTHPVNNETFAGNILASIDVNEPDGIAAVALSFNQASEVQYLCNNTTQCSGTNFHITETSINPADFNIYSGPLTLGLWVIDVNQNQMQVDAVTVNWQRRRITDVIAIRNDTNDSVSLSWQGQSELIRYNIYLASEENVTQQNYQQLADGQAVLAIENTNYTFNGLTANKTYYLLIVGVDGSGESAFSSQIRMDAYAGNANQAPIANNENLTGNQGQTISGNLLANDSDDDGNILTVTVIPLRSPKFGDVTIQSSGDFSYVPQGTFSGQDSFDYEIQDGQGGFAQATTYIDIIAGNVAPQAVDDNYSVAINQSLTISAPGLLTNDTDLNGDSLSVTTTPIINVANGSLTLAVDGSFIYSPNSDFVGEDNFTYQIQDTFGLTDTAQVMITVGGQNTPPNAVNDSYATMQNITLVVDGTTYSGVLANDTDPDNDSIQLTNTLINNVDNGTLTISTDGLFTYIPNTNFTGVDSFVYEITDGQGGFAQATVMITVATVNQAPIAIDDNYTVDQGGFLDVDGIVELSLLDNDSDPENDTLTVNTTPVTDVNNGTLVLANDGTFTYEPNPSFFGNDSFEYEIDDGNGNFAIAFVDITVNQGNSLPIARPDFYFVSPNNSLSITASTVLPYPLDNDSDPDFDTLNYNSVNYSVENGNFNDSFDSSFDYTPNVDFTGVDSFFYEIDDGNGGFSEALVTILVSRISWGGIESLPNLPLVDFQGISFDGKLYFLVANNNIFVSSNGTTWGDHFHNQVTPILAVAGGNTNTSPSVETNVAVGDLNNSFVQQTDGVIGWWAKRNNTTNIAMQNVIFNRGEFIATGMQAVLFSADGLSWVTRTPNTAVLFNSFVHDLGRMVIVGNNGTIEMSNTSGVSWLVQTSNTTNNLTDIVSNNVDTYVAIGSAGTVLSSNNGSTWVSRTSNTTSDLSAIAYGAGIYLAVGNNSTVITSNDGINWTTSALVSSPLNDVIFDGSKFILVGDQASFFSTTDGISFQTVASGDNVTNLTGIAFGNSNVIRAGNPDRLFKSTDGLSWTQVTSQNYAVNQVEYFNNAFIAVGDAGLILTSPTGDVWTAQSSSTTKNINDIFWYSGFDVQGAPFNLYVAVGDNGLFMTSTDGITWQVEAVNGTVSENFYGIDHDNDYFVAVGQNGKILVRNNTATPNGTTWMDFFSNTAFGTLQDIIYNGSTNIIVGANGVIVTGTAQGGNFPALDTTFSDNLNTIAFDINNKYIIGSDNGVMFTSADGTNWLKDISTSSSSIRDIIVINTAIYGVGDGGKFIKGTLN